MVDSFLTCMLLFCGFLLCIWQGFLRRPAGKGERLMLCAPDEDIRIVTGSPSASLRPSLDTGESVAEEFRHHKENGNIFMANRLGEELTKPLLNGDGELFGGLWPKYAGQLSFLYALAVRSAVEKEITNTILADTVLHSFSETVENTDADFYCAISDSVADTIYRLCLADGQQVGSGFAKLCGQAEDPHFIGEGNAAFQRFWDFSVRRIGRIPFK